MLDMKDQVPIDPAPVDVGARFKSRAAAEHAVQRLVAVDIAPAQVEILEGEGHMQAARSIEKRATKTALIRWHVLLGAGGLLLGALCWLFAWYARMRMVLAMPGLMLFVAVGFGVVAGLLLGGFISMRPTKGWLAAAARDDARAGDFPVVVHATGRQQARKAQEILSAAEGEAYLFTAGS